MGWMLMASSKSLRVARVDGEGEDGAEVLAPGQFFGADARVDELGGFLHALGVGGGEAVFGEDGVHLGVVVAFRAEHDGDFAARVAGVGRPSEDVDGHFVAVLGAFELVEGDHDVVGEGVGGCEQIGGVLGYLEGADVGLAAALDDFHDASFQAFAAVLLGVELHAHAVAGQGVAGVLVVDADAGPVGQVDEVASARGAVVDALDEGCGEVAADFSLLVAHDLVLLEHLVEEVDAHHLGGVRREVELTEELLEGVVGAGRLLQERLHLGSHLVLGEHGLLVGFL